MAGFWPVEVRELPALLPSVDAVDAGNAACARPVRRQARSAGPSVYEEEGQTALRTFVDGWLGMGDLLGRLVGDGQFEEVIERMAE